ncbi:GNAT family N-acetyltransferase [Brevundimonas aurifodinae]|uniref:GNAT family N-acetyltransferase n=2 Tax=Brevundimonas TaxID=41275 RepID=A0ABV1NS72_9CAUL
MRSAKTSDLEALIDLNAVVQSLHATLEPAQFLTQADRDGVAALFSATLEKEPDAILVAEIDGALVGYVWLEVQERPATLFSPPRTRAYVHHLAVHEGARRLGAGSALMRAAESESRARGVRRMVLDAWATNEGAQHFFQAEGFVPFNIVLEKALE